MKFKLLKLFFYHQYAWQERVGNADIAPFSTIAWMGFVVTIDIFGILALLSPFCPFIKSMTFTFPVPFVLSLIVFYFVLEYRYDYKRMVSLAKVIVGKRGKWLWIINLYIITILFPVIVVLLLWAYNNGYIYIYNG